MAAWDSQPGAFLKLAPFLASVRCGVNSPLTQPCRVLFPFLYFYFVLFVYAFKAWPRRGTESCLPDCFGPGFVFLLFFLLRPSLKVENEIENKINFKKPSGDGT